MFVVWMSLINRGEFKQACPVGLMSAGSESSEGMKEKRLLQHKCLYQRFSVSQQMHVDMNLQLNRWCSDTCEPQRGTQAQVIAALYTLCCTESEFISFVFGKGPTSEYLKHVISPKKNEREKVERKENKKPN